MALQLFLSIFLLVILIVNQSNCFPNRWSSSSDDPEIHNINTRIKHNNDIVSRKDGRILFSSDGDDPSPKPIRQKDGRMVFSSDDGDDPSPQPIRQKDGRMVFSSDDGDDPSPQSIRQKDGRMVFSSDDDDEQPPQFIPTVKNDCQHSTFCENAPNYPNEFLEDALRENKTLTSLSAVDLVSDIKHRFGTFSEDVPLCDSHEKVVYPKVAQNKDKNWLFVVNQGDFAQGVRVETCRKKNSVCNLVDGFTEGYKTVCKQKYIYRQLVAVLPGGQIKPEMFRFPASCCCHIKFVGNPLVRIGLSINKKNKLKSSL